MCGMPSTVPRRGHHEVEAELPLECVAGCEDHVGHDRESLAPDVEADLLTKLPLTGLVGCLARLDTTADHAPAVVTKHALHEDVSVDHPQPGPT